MTLNLKQRKEKEAQDHMASELANNHRFEKLLVKYKKLLSEAILIGNKELIASIQKRINILERRLTILTTKNNLHLT